MAKEGHGNFLLTGTLLLVATGFSVSQAATGKTDSLKLVQVIFRHGDRAPTKSYPNDPYINDFDKLWPEGFAQLTNRGKMQQYELGQFLRHRYDGYLGKKYSPAELYVTSSDMDRTIMSLESNLAGLFPPVMNPWNPNLDWQPIPLRTIPRKADKYLHNNVKCPRYSQLRHDFYSFSDVVRKLNVEHKDFIRYCAQHSGLDITTVKGLYPLLDVFYAQAAHNYTLPTWAQGATLPKLLDLTSIVNTWPTYTDEMKRLWGGPFLELLLENMLAITGSTKSHEESEVVVHSVHKGAPRKMIMYSAHDSTLDRIMNTMGVFDPHCPPYASALILELHQDQHSLDYHIEIHYRNDTTRTPYQLTHPMCSHPCKLETYLEVTRHLIPVDWKQECRLDFQNHHDIPHKAKGGEKGKRLLQMSQPTPYASLLEEQHCVITVPQLLAIGFGFVIMSTFAGFVITVVLQRRRANGCVYEGDYVQCNGNSRFFHVYSGKPIFRRSAYEKL